MAHGWLLMETLGDEPLIVAQGRALKNMVPLRVFLRRSPFLSVIERAVARAKRTGEGSTEVLPDQHRVIRTEVILMSDGRVHGVQVWSGPVGSEIPEQPMVGAILWDLTTGVATDTRESLINSGMDPDTEQLHPRAFAEDMPRKEISPSETKVLSLTISAEPGERICTAWDVTDRHGNLINVAFVARANPEIMADGSTHMISRAMNWRGERPNPALATDNLAQRILSGLAQPGIHRALADINTWTLLKWLDDPCPHYDWRNTTVHPDDEVLVKAMTDEFAHGPSSRVLRLRGTKGGWVRIHVTVNRVELDERKIAGLVTLRLPLSAELDALPPVED